MSATNDSIACPVCKKDDSIQRLSAVVSAGTSSGTYSGPSGGVTRSDGKVGSYGGYTTLQGSSTTSLARLLAPPPKPQHSDAMFTKGEAIGYYLFVAVASVVTVGLALIAFLIGVGIGGLPEIVENKETAKAERIAELARWEQAVRYWQQLYYCHRDAVVFDPISGKHTDATRTTEFVYQNAPTT